MSSVIKGFLFLLCALAIAFAVAVWQNLQAPPTPTLFSATVIEPQPLQAFTLTSTKGGEITLDTLKGNWTFIYFGYTSCPDICPAALTKLKDVAQLLADDPANFIFVSADPKRDSLENLQAYVEMFSDQIIGGLGTHDQVVTLAKQLYVYLSNASDPDAPIIDHSDTVLLVNPKAELTAIYQSPPSAQAIANDYYQIAHIH